MACNKITFGCYKCTRMHLTAPRWSEFSRAGNPSHMQEGITHHSTLPHTAAFITTKRAPNTLLFPTDVLFQFKNPELQCTVSFSFFLQHI